MLRFRANLILWHYAKWELCYHRHLDRHHLHAAVRSVGHVVVIMSSTECRLTLSVHLKRLQHSSFSEIIETDRMPVRLTGVMDNLSTAVPRAHLSSSYVTLHLNCDSKPKNLHHHEGYKKHVLFEYSDRVRTWSGRSVLCIPHSFIFSRSRFDALGLVIVTSVLLYKNVIISLPSPSPKNKYPAKLWLHFHHALKLLGLILFITYNLSSLIRSKLYSRVCLTLADSNKLENIRIKSANLCYHQFIQANSFCNYESMLNYLRFKTLYSRRQNLGALFLINVFENKIDCSIMDAVPTKQIRYFATLKVSNASQLQTTSADISGYFQ
jgi:hypothetical protein